MGVLLLVVRLEVQTTDVVIAVNVPHVREEYAKEGVDLEAGKAGALLEAGDCLRERVRETLSVKDWGLFGE